MVSVSCGLPHYPPAAVRVRPGPGSTSFKFRGRRSPLRVQVAEKIDRAWTGPGQHLSGRSPLGGKSTALVIATATKVPIQVRSLGPLGWYGRSVRASYKVAVWPCPPAQTRACPVG